MNRKLGLRVSSKRAHRALSRLFGPARPSSTCPVTIYQTVSEGLFSETRIPFYETLSIRTGSKGRFCRQRQDSTMPLATRLDRYAGNLGRGGKRRALRVASFSCGDALAGAGLPSISGHRPA